MAFLGGLFGGGSKSTTTTSNATATSVENTVGVDVSATISPVINTAIDLTGISEAVGKVAGVLNTVAGSLAKSQEAVTERETEIGEKQDDFLGTLSKFGGAATAVLAMMAIYFALRDPGNVKVQL